MLGVVSQRRRTSIHPFTLWNHHDRRDHYNNAIIESLVSRSATSLYDPAVTLTDDQIRELVRITTAAPTSFHLQNWRFIAVRAEAEARLVRSPGINPRSPLQLSPSSSAAS